MQVKLNLAIRPSLRERYGVYWTLPLVVVSLGAFLWMISHGVSYYERYRIIQNQISRQQDDLAGLEKREEVLRKQFDQPGFRGTALKAMMVNTLIERKVVSFPVVTEQVARLLPADVRLTGMALSFGQTGPAVRIAVVGKSQSAVEGVLKALQDSPEFADSEIQSEDPGMRENGEDGVAMVLSARYVGKMDRT